MKILNNRLISAISIFLPVVLILLIGCSEKDSSEENHIKKESVLTQENTSSEIAVTAPPFSEGIFPCSACHEDQETDPERRILWMHDEIDESFNHDNENRWCLDCHDGTNRDFLRLASGKLLDFKDSYKLCGQCHGDKLRDWKVGVHGKRTGNWNGEKQYLLCVHCHNPHSPKFKKIQPEPPPIRQEDL